jgi:hypothetical protein
MTSYRNDLLCIGLIALAVVIWFHPFFVLGEVLVPPNATSAYPWYGTDAYVEPHPQGSMDAVRENYISWALTHRYLDEGHAPNWNPYILAGNPMLANQFATPYSPFKLLNLIFSAPAAWSWAIVIKSFVNGLFTYLTLRALKRSPIAATIGALAWMLSWPLAHQTQTTYSEGVALMPAAFFFALKSLQSEHWRCQWIWGISGAIVTSSKAGELPASASQYSITLGSSANWGSR